MTVELTHFADRAGDHNDRAMSATPALTAVFEAKLGVAATVIGKPQPALSTGWAEELEAARPALQSIAGRYEDILSAGATPVTALSRCAVALATLPVVAKHRPDAVVVWFDAHGDLNTPENTGTGYLGGLAFSGPLGFWDSGLGQGLASSNAVLVGARDLDPPEQQLVDDGTIGLIPVSDTMAEELRELVDRRPVYVHIDCDVLEPGTVPTDYHVGGGMTLGQLHACAEVLATTDVVGLEVGELEAPGGSDGAGPATKLLDALEPLLRAKATWRAVPPRA